MTIWMVRAGRRGEQEQEALDANVVTIHWNELPDLSSISDREVLTEIYRNTYRNEIPAQVASRAGQVWAFCHRIEPGHLVILPLHAQAAVAIGKVTGPYCYRTDLGEDILHTRPVQWLCTDLSRMSFQQDLLANLSLPPTVYQIKHNNAAERIHVLLENRHDPGILHSAVAEANDSDADIQIGLQDIEQSATDQILSYIQNKFTRHEFADLVNAVLQAEGYFTQVSPPGPDGGVDILAGAEPLGFGSPRLCVQVKSSTRPTDVNVLRGLQGILQNFGADQGLLVCWGGYTNPVIQESRQSFFTIRLWKADDILQAILKNYHKLPSDIQAELPLKQIWALVPEEQ